MALLQRGRYKRDKLEPLLIPLVTEVLTHLPENPAQFMLDQLAQHVTHKPGESVVSRKNVVFLNNLVVVAIAVGINTQVQLRQPRRERP